MTTPLDALSYLLLSLPTDPNPSPLITQLAVACANHPQARELLNTFIEEFTLERRRLIGAERGRALWEIEIDGVIGVVWDWEVRGHT